MTTISINPQTNRPPIRSCVQVTDTAVSRTLSELQFDGSAPDHKVMMLAGIGSSGTIQNNPSTYGYHPQHGRVLPAATGVALSNPLLAVVATDGTEAGRRSAGDN